jgi:hypothetical protein
VHRTADQPVPFQRRERRGEHFGSDGTDHFPQVRKAYGPPASIWTINEARLSPMRWKVTREAQRGSKMLLGAAWVSIR